MTVGKGNHVTTGLPHFPPLRCRQNLKEMSEKATIFVVEIKYFEPRICSIICKKKKKSKTSFLTPLRRTWALRQAQWEGEDRSAGKRVSEVKHGCSKCILEVLKFTPQELWGMQIPKTRDSNSVGLSFHPR